MTHYIVFSLLLLASSVYAFWRGGAPERIGAAILLGGVILTAIVMPPALRRYDAIQWPVFSVDAGALVALLALAMFSKRYWPLWLTAIQMLQVLSHFSRLLPGVIALVYAMASSLLMYPSVAVLVIATWRHRRRLRTFGTDASWLTFSRLSRLENRIK
jgi:hypothetical protein